MGSDDLSVFHFLSNTTIKGKNKQRMEDANILKDSETPIEKNTQPEKDKESLLQKSRRSFKSCSILKLGMCFKIASYVIERFEDFV